MAFLSSNKIKVFPTAFRGQDASGHAIDPGSFLTTEENFVNIANKITYLHKDYFYVDGNSAYIILGGYYFSASVSDIQALFSNPQEDDEIWACINVADFGSAYESTSVKTLTPNGGSAGETLDDSTNFKGLTFLGKNDNKDSFTCKLKLFVYGEYGWMPFASSELNISTYQIENLNSGKPIKDVFTTFSVYAASVSTTNASVTNLVVNSGATIGGADVNSLNVYSNFSVTSSVSSAYILAKDNIQIGFAVSSTNVTESVNIYGASLYMNCQDITTYASNAKVHWGSYDLEVDTPSVPAQYPVNFTNTRNHYGESVSISLGANLYYNTSWSAGQGSYIISGTTLSISCWGYENVPHFTNIYGMGNVNLRGINTITLNDEDVILRPYEHNIELRGTAGGVQASQFARIFFNLRLDTSEPLSTYDDLRRALCCTNHFANVVYSNKTYNSPLLATGWLYSDSKYCVEAIGFYGEVRNPGPALYSTCLKASCWYFSNYYGGRSDITIPIDYYSESLQARFWYVIDNVDKMIPGFPYSTI